MTALLTAALWSAAATLAALGAARVWRPADAALWHRVWVTIAGASLLLPFAQALPARALVAVPVTADVLDRSDALGRAAATDVALAIYAIGLAYGGLRLLTGLLLVGRLRRGSRPLIGLPLDWVRAAAGGNPAVVHSHPRVQVPIATGWRRPVVILPEAWLACDPARLVAVLHHELAHVARHDFRWNVLGAIFRSVFWFSPVAWIVTERIRLTSELDADRSASRVLGRLPYARLLIESARDLVQAPRSGVLAPSAAAALDARVAALTSPAGHSQPTRSLTRRLVVVLVAAGLISTALVGLRVPDPAPAGDHEALHAVRHARH